MPKPQPEPSPVEQVANSSCSLTVKQHWVLYHAACILPNAHKVEVMLEMLRAVEPGMQWP